MLIKDKLLLENLTRKYGKDFVINEMARGRKSKFTPSELYNMTEIPYEYFKDRKDLKEIVIPDNITAIRSHAFDGCTSLTSVTIGNSVTSIGEEAFSNCTSLTSITIPDSVTSIGNTAFYKCTSLAKVTIPDSVTNIGVFAFSKCSSLTSVIIPDSVTKIGGYAFWNCTSLTSITIPDSVTWIGKGAFENCASLKSVTIPDSVNVIDDDVFLDCRNLKKIEIRSNHNIRIGKDAIPERTKVIRKKFVKSNIDVTKKERDTRYNNNPLNIERNRKRDSLNKWIPSDDNSYGNYDKWFENLDIETLEVITGYDYEEYEEENLTKEDFYEDCLEWWDKLNDRKKERIYNKVNKFLKKNDNSSNSSSNKFNYNYTTLSNGLKYRKVGDRTYTYLGSEKDLSKWNASRTSIARKMYDNTEDNPKQYPCEIVTESSYIYRAGREERVVYYYFRYE